LLEEERTAAKMMTQAASLLQKKRGKEHKNWIKAIHKTYQKRCRTIRQHEDDLKAGEANTAHSSLRLTASSNPGESLTGNTAYKTPFHEANGKGRQKRKGGRTDHPPQNQETGGLSQQEFNEKMKEFMDLNEDLDVYYSDCKLRQPSKNEKRMQELYRAKLYSKEAIKWRKTRKQCKHPLKQYVKESWVAVENGYELMLEVVTEHEPCEIHALKGMKRAIFVEQKEQSSLMQILKIEANVTNRIERSKEACSMSVESGASLLEAAAGHPISPTDRHWDAEEDDWIDGNMGHETINVEVCVDGETHKNTGITDPTGDAKIRPVKEYTCVIDTGTQVTAIGRKHAEELGIDIDKLEPVRQGLRSISGEKVQPIGSFFATITGRYRKKNGANAAVIAKDIVYVFPSTSNIFLSRAALIALGVIKKKNKIGDHLEEETKDLAAASTIAIEEMTCNETRDAEGNRACRCPDREPVPDPPKFKGEWTARNVDSMKNLLLRHYASSSFNVCKLQSQPNMSELPPVTLRVDEAKYKPRKFTQASNVPMHLEKAEKAGLDADIMAGVIRKVGMEEENTGIARQVVVAKPTKPGEPVKIRRTVDFKWLNAHIDPHVFHCEPPIRQAMKIGEHRHRKTSGSGETNKTRRTGKDKKNSGLQMAQRTYRPTRLPLRATHQASHENTPQQLENGARRKRRLPQCTTSRGIKKVDALHNKAREIRLRKTTTRRSISTSSLQ